MEKFLEYNGMTLAIFGVSLFGILKWFLSRLTKAFEREKKERATSDEAIRAILHNKIYKQGICYLERNYITVDELNDLEKLYKPYKEMGGNSTAETIIRNVRRLEIRKSEIQKLKEKGDII